MQKKLPISSIENYLHSLHDTAKVVILLLDRDANILYINKYITELSGYKRDFLIGKNWIQVFIPFSNDNLTIKNVFNDVIAEKDMCWSSENAITCKDGSSKILSWNHSLCLDKEGNFEAVMAIGVDITELRKSEQDLQNKIEILFQEKEKQRFLINNLTSIVIETDGNQLIDANDRLIEFFGYDSLEEFQFDVSGVCEKFLEHPNFFHLGLVGKNQNWVDVLFHLPQAKQVVIMSDKNNELHAFSVKLTHILHSPRYIVSFDDITDLMTQSKEFEYKATHDALTTVFNRAKFNEILKSLDTTSKNVLLMMDIDHFKSINDTYGHQVGDKVLKNLASMVKHMIRPIDIFARWGGEEFMLLLKDISKEDAYLKAEEIREYIANFQSQNLPKFTISIGMSTIKPKELSYQYLKRVDEALYDSKASGRNCTTIR